MEKRKRLRKGVFVVVHRKGIFFKNRKYLLLKRKLHWEGWEFPKGGIEKGEKALEAAKREIKEETDFDVDVEDIKKYDCKGEYLYEKELKDRPGVIGQTYELFSVEFPRFARAIKYDVREHTNFKWVSYKQAMKMLTWDNQKEALKLVEDSLKG